jgi:hypothetical protein
MAGVLIGTILSFLLFFIFTRTVWVRVIKEELTRVEIHLPLLALKLKFGKDKQGGKDRKKSKLGARSYIKIISAALSRIYSCELVIKRVALPCKINSFGAATLISPFGYQGLVYAVIAYLKTKIQRLAIEDNAIISSPDISETQFYFTVKLRLYQLLYTLMTIRRGVKEEKLRLGEKKNARE